jgi:hypothetical protein
MDGRIFWQAGSDALGNMTILSCSVSDCAGTTQVFPTPPVGNTGNPTYISDPVVCDPSNHELVWKQWSTTVANVDSYQVLRASTSGGNVRVLTSFTLPDDSTLADPPIFAPGRSDRLYFTQKTAAPPSETIYQLSTITTGAAPIGIVAGDPTVLGDIGLTGYANDNLFVWSVQGSNGNQGTSFEVPLPNGIISANPSVFYAGELFAGVMDNQNFYGLFQGLPSDAVGRCPVANCVSPTVMVRGQQIPMVFAQDSTAVYWSSSNDVTKAFTIWKVAK